MTFADVMERERSALLGESVIKPSIGVAVLPYAAVTAPEVVVRSPMFLRALHPVHLEDLKARDRRHAFVQSCPSLHYKYLWVHVDNDQYRDDYITFLRDFHGITERLPGNLHADHVYNRDRARDAQTPFVRLVLTAQSINTSHGAGYEKSRTRGGLFREGRDHTIDEIVLMKLCGIPSPKRGQPLTAEMRAHIHRVAQLSGLPPQDIERNIKELMEVAAFRP